MNPFSHTGLSISDSLKSVRKSVLIYETIIANIREKLEANEIKYNLNTKRNSNILLDIIHSDMAARAKLPYSYTEEKIKYYYVIYVRKKDYAKAKKLCS